MSVDESVRTAETGVGDEKLPETGLTVSVVGVAETTVGAVAAIELAVHGEPVEVRRLRRRSSAGPGRWRGRSARCQPDSESPVQNEVPLGSTLTAKSWPWQLPGSERARVGLDHVAVLVQEHAPALGVRDEHVAVGEDPDLEGAQAR